MSEKVQAEVIDAVFNQINALGGEYLVTDLTKYLKEKYPEVETDDVVKILEAEELAEVGEGLIKLIEEPRTPARPIKTLKIKTVVEEWEDPKNLNSVVKRVLGMDLEEMEMKWRKELLENRYLTHGEGGTVYTPDGYFFYPDKESAEIIEAFFWREQLLIKKMKVLWRVIELIKNRKITEYLEVN